MTLAERLILYVVQRITDEEAVPSRTRLLKIIYLIDVEFFRRHRRILTGWNWVFYYYGPYVFEFPKLLDRLEFASLNEVEDFTSEGRKFFKYKVTDSQNIDDLVSFSDRTRIDKIIKRWALEDLNLLLNHVYFETDPMRGAQRGKVLDFDKIPHSRFTPTVDWSDVAPSREQVTQLRKKFAGLIKDSKEDKTKTEEVIARRPFIADEDYLNWKNSKRQGAWDLPEDISVISSE